MTVPEHHIVSWLRDVHAAEEQAETMLTQLANRLESYPQLKGRIEEHIVETRRHAERVEECLNRLNSGTSIAKDVGTKLMGLGQGLSGMFTSDEVMKGVLATYAFEHMEIASYKILIAGAKHVGDAESQKVCEGILKEEQAMAKWLEDNFETVTQAFLTRETDESAKARH